ncbi:serine hydrolase domain-containing protein [Nocardiopsis suaedae]|uniref:Serine hydrolase n=1 Tax=Nocardiopsis suaedae TaxID=3018444 RepID=A0ABT4TIK0_9ACTN|nr:serine hydrolase domain-containing protein [Nocardiopsis suaedae]MDA2804480.1 serine hydrolase [Nocardiopsis suaedae]
MDKKRWAAAAGVCAVALAAGGVLVAAPWSSDADAPAPSASSPPPEPPRISAERRLALQRALNETVAGGSASGAVAEYVEHGEGGSDSWSGVAGVADLSTDVPVDPQAHFRVASISKPFVAATVLQLVEEGRVRLDDTLEDVLPGLVDGGDRITLRMVLSHTSGLYSYNKSMPSVRSDPGRAWRPEELVEIANEHDPVFPPGSDVEYSNTNYVLAALVIEKVTGNPYREEVQARILDPLGLTETSIPTGTGVPAPSMHGYAWVSDGAGGHTAEDVTSFDTSRWYGTAQVVSTVSDINTYWRALLDGEVLGAEVLEEMLTVQAYNAGDYGYALGPRSYTLECGTRVWMHPGNIPGHRTWTVHSEDRDLTVFQARYREDPDPPAWAMIELAMCPEDAPGDPSPSPTPEDYPSEDVAGTGRGKDGGK